MKPGFLDIARALARLPTAPFHEHFTIDFVRSFAAKRPRLKITFDRYGNCLLLYNGDGEQHDSPLILTAHLDHPGLVWKESTGPGRSHFEIKGGVDAKQALASDVRIYDLNRPASQRGSKGRIIATKATKSRYPLLEIEWNARTGQGPGTFAMWDVPAFACRGRRIHGRALDDLAGVAAGLSVLDELHRRRAPATLGLLLTRAEEVGFVGMLAAIEAKFLRRRALYINIECSSIKAGAKQGAGPIIRVGDRLWVFDPLISGGLVSLADDLAEKDPNFLYQRKLMDSGACEATALMQAGYRTGAVALPLGNYHNSGPGNKLAPENIHLNDALLLVQLLTHLAQHGIDDALRQSGSALDAMMAKRLANYREQLDPIKTT